MYYEVKVKRQLLNEKGTEIEKLTEYLAENCELFADAELKGLQVDCSTDVVGIKRSKIKEVVNTADPSKDEHLYNAEVECTTVGDDLKEKKMRYTLTIWSESLEKAHDSMVAYLKQGYDDMRLVSIKETKLEDII